MESNFWVTWLRYFNKLLVPATLTTLYIIVATMLLAFIFGFGISILMVLYGPKGLNPRKNIYRVLNFTVNTIRSFPVLLLIVAMIPVTRAVLGTVVGSTAAVLPLSVAATAFIGRLFENNFKEVDSQLIEAARSFGASDAQIVFRVIVKESIPSMVNSMVLTTITFLAGTVIAGVVGGGGLGSVAMNYGYQNFNNTILYSCVVILFIMVMGIQYIGDRIYKKLSA